MSVFRGKAEVARTRPNRRFDPKRSSRGCAARYSKINVPRGASESPGAVSVVNRCQQSRLRSTVTERAHLEMGRDGRKRIMTLRSAFCAMCLAGLAGSGLAQAGTNDILIGLDNKITYGP